jgi:hypothetical protein
MDVEKTGEHVVLQTATAGSIAHVQTLSGHSTIVAVVAGSQPARPIRNPRENRPARSVYIDPSAGAAEKDRD